MNEQVGFSLQVATIGFLIVLITLLIICGVIVALGKTIAHIIRYGGANGNENTIKQYHQESDNNYEKKIAAISAAVIHNESNKLRYFYKPTKQKIYEDNTVRNWAFLDNYDSWEEIW